MLLTVHGQVLSLHTLALDYAGASAHCMDLGGRLASIHDTETELALSQVSYGLAFN